MSEPIGAHATAAFPRLAAGDYTVSLAQPPSNCTGTGFRTVTVPAGGTVSTTFSISCTSEVGELSVTTSTTGTDIDPLYSLSISGPFDFGSQPMFIDPNQTMSWRGIPSGDYTLTLGDVSSNCTLSGANPRTVAVPTGGIGSTTFSVSCSTAGT